MESLYILIPIAIVFVCIAIGIFLWAVKSEQFEDLERQGHNILFDEDSQFNIDTKPKVAPKETSDSKTTTVNEAIVNKGIVSEGNKESSDKQSSNENQSNIEKKNDDA
jgi:cbb3-type cytochrome oxidase maturation protein